jgi:hypothetical protein
MLGTEANPAGLSLEESPSRAARRSRDSETSEDPSAHNTLRGDAAIPRVPRSAQTTPRREAARSAPRVPVEALARLNALNAPLRRLAVLPIISVPIISALELLSFVRARATNNVAVDESAECRFDEVTLSACKQRTSDEQLGSPSGSCQMSQMIRQGVRQESTHLISTTQIQHHFQLRTSISKAQTLWNYFFVPLRRPRLP